STRPPTTSPAWPNPRSRSTSWSATSSASACTTSTAATRLSSSRSPTCIARSAASASSAATRPGPTRRKIRSTCRPPSAWAGCTTHWRPPATTATRWKCCWCGCCSACSPPAVEAFKFRHFGHDSIVLHETDIRKERGSFRFTDRSHRVAFFDELTGIIEDSKFILIGCLIDKRKLRERDQVDGNPYHLALGFCLEALYELMQEKGQATYPTHVVAECRGKKEDRDLELEF